MLTTDDKFCRIFDSIREGVPSHQLASCLAVAAALWAEQTKRTILELSQREVGNLAGRSQATTGPVLRELERIGVLTVVRSPYRSVHRYYLNPPAAECAPRKTSKVRSRPQTATMPLKELQTPQDDHAADRRAQILEEIEQLHASLEKREDGLLRISPAQKEQLAGLHTELISCFGLPEGRRERVITEIQRISSSPLPPTGHVNVLRTILTKI